MKKSTMVVVFVALVLSALPLRAAVDISGTWEMTTQSQRGERTTEITITQDGEKITVTMPGRRGGDPTVAEGTIQGNTVEWSVTRDTPRGEFTINYKGTVSEDGTSMSGTSEMGDRGASEWTATKK